MNKGQTEFAERQALNNFDKWNNVTGVFAQGTSYYNEICGVIINAVHIGIQMALHDKINFNEDGELIKGDYHD